MANTFKMVRSTVSSMISGIVRSVFSVVSLFKDGQQGFWYDPTEIDTLYQDSNGTTPVTLAGEPVGLVIDKSQGAELGLDLITDSDFNSGINISYDTNYGNITFGTDGTTLSNTTGATYIVSDNAPLLVVGRSYKYRIVIGEGSDDAGVRPKIGGVNTPYYSYNAGNGVYEGIVTALTPNEPKLYRHPWTGTCIVESFEVWELKGNHATQSISAARPTYNDTPERLTLDKVDDSVGVNIPVGGWIGSMVLATDQGTASYNVDIPAGNYEIGGHYFPGNSINNVLMREGVISASDLAQTEATFVSAGAKSSYGDVIDFSSYWRDMTELTSFPLLDTSSGTNFKDAWLSNNLTSFPLLDTSSGTNFQGAWYDCNSLTSFPLIDTSSGTNFSYTWFNCDNLTSFPLIDTSSGTTFSQTWRDCNSLTSFPLLDTSSGADFYYTWYNCNSLTSFPLLDISSGTNFNNTWRNCSSLTSFPLIDTFSGTTFYRAWYGCSSLTSFPLIDTSSGTNFSYTWFNCKSLTSFPLLDTSSGTNFSYTWTYCTELTSFPLIDTSSGTNFSYTWYGCSSLTSFPLLDTSSGTSFSYTWYGCSSLTSFPLLDTSSGTSFYQAWRNCSSLTSFPLLDTSSGTDFDGAWLNCNSLTSFPLLDTSSGTSFYQTWRDCNSLTSFPLLDTSSGAGFSNTWRNCSSLTSFPLIDTSSGTDFSVAWYGCKNLTSFPLIDTSSGTSFNYTWYNCKSLTSFPLLDTSSGTSFSNTWLSCNSLTSFPSNFFDSCVATYFTGAFANTNLSQQSIDGILVSINSNATSNGTFNQSGGSAPSATGEAAITAMRSRGWTVTVTGGF